MRKKEKELPLIVVGMSLRDWFAGQVLATFIKPENPEIVAKWSYKIADAMLAERRKE